MYLGGALRRTPFFAIRRPGRGSHFGQCGDLNRDAFWAVGGGIFARDREDSPAHILVKPPNGNVPNRTATNAPVNRNARRAVSSR